MKCILLAAGYATRLYPLTKDKPKSLLEICGQTVLDHILNEVDKVDEIDTIYIVSNDKFYNQFLSWSQEYKSSKNLKIINDRTTTNETRLGAIADIAYVIEHEDVTDDILVMAGDNLFDFDLRKFIEYSRLHSVDCITVHELYDEMALRNTGVVVLDHLGKVISFEEKPSIPKSNLAVPPFYIYKADTLTLIRQYLIEGQNSDAPGNFIPWLIERKSVYGFKFEGTRYDIGTVDNYLEVQEIYQARIKQRL